MCGDPALLADPYPFYDEIRAAGALVPGKFAVLTARYDVVSEIGHDPATFLSGFPDETRPRPVRAALDRARDPAVISAVDRPCMLVTNGPDHTRLRCIATKAFTAHAWAA